MSGRPESLHQTTDLNYERLLHINHMEMGTIRLRKPTPPIWLQKRLKLIQISALSLFYNDFLSWSYVIDTLLEPLLWMVDSFAKVLGPLFVAGVVILTSSVVAIAYHSRPPVLLDSQRPLDHRSHRHIRPVFLHQCHISLLHGSNDPTWRRSRSKPTN